MYFSIVTRNLHFKDFLLLHTHTHTHTLSSSSSNIQRVACSLSKPNRLSLNRNFLIQKRCKHTIFSYDTVKNDERKIKYHIARGHKMENERMKRKQANALEWNMSVA